MVFEEWIIYKDMIEKKLHSFFDTIKDDGLNPLLIDDVDLLESYVFAPGKRIRPIALIMAYMAFTNFDEKILLASLSVELLHNSSLIFDDIMDEDDYRRNMPGIQKKLKDRCVKNGLEKHYEGALFSCFSKRYAVSRSILIALSCDVLSRECLLRSKFPHDKVLRCIAELNHALDLLIKGQALDLEMEKERKTTEKDYLDMAYMKTGALFIASFRIGGILSGCSEEQLEILTKYSRNISLAFQIKDDILDYYGSKGHDIGSDIKNGKMTLPMIKALEMSDKDDHSFLLSALGDPSVDDSAIKRSIEIIRLTGALDYCTSLADGLIMKARSCITGIGSDSKEDFLKFADLMANRDR